MMAPSPAEIYFTPHVDNPLLSKKFSTLKTRIGFISFHLGNALPFEVK
jgi:hypothetical protein